MKILIVVMMFFCTCVLKAQTVAEKAFTHVVNQGPNTGPEFIVVNVHKVKTFQTKEMILSVNALYECLATELVENDRKKIKQILLSKSADRTITLTNPEALDRIHFDDLKPNKLVNKEKEIDKEINKYHLVDSLLKIQLLREKLRKFFYEYSALRESLLKKIADSISNVRTLNTKELDVLSTLRDPYYDIDEKHCANLITDTKDDAISRQNILKIWHNKSSLYNNYKLQNAYNYKEVDRCEIKFFRSYVKRYGIIFCKVLFKYGVITGFGDENPQIYFEQVIKNTSS